ncbi:MAG: hypothetical protein WKF50_08310 [Nocardioides sp.]
MTRRTPAAKKTPARTSKRTAVKKLAVKKSAAKRAPRTPPVKKPVKKPVATTRRKPAANKAPPRRAPAKKTTAPAAKKAPAKQPAKRSTPRRKAPPRGLVEHACHHELEILDLHETALGVSAVALARLADRAETASAGAAALREMRMTINAAQTRGNMIPAVLRGGDPRPPEDRGDDENVVPESRLQRVRREREEQRARGN